MLDKQLDFYNIFDEANKKPNEKEADPEAEPVSKTEEISIASCLAGYSPEQREQRAQLLDETKNLPTENFLPFFKEIDIYIHRLAIMKEKIKNLAVGETKDKLYGILVRPTENDKPEYRETAQLMENYRRAAMRDLQAAAERYPSEKKAEEKRLAKLEREKEKEKIKAQNGEEEGKEVGKKEDKPAIEITENPYSDIYPMAPKKPERK